MKRDELLQKISALPPDTDIGVEVGGDHLDITEIVLWGNGDFAALKCNSHDLCDMLQQWGIPKWQRGRIALDEQNGA